jgi:hypothetical protein
MAIPSIKSLLPDIVATYYLSLGVPKDRLNSIVYDDPEKIMMTLKSTLTELHKEAPPRDAIVIASYYNYGSFGESFDTILWTPSGVCYAYTCLDSRGGYCGLGGGEHYDIKIYKEGKLEDLVDKMTQAIGEAIQDCGR